MPYEWTYSTDIVSLIIWADTARTFKFVFSLYKNLSFVCVYTAVKAATDGQRPAAATGDGDGVGITRSQRACKAMRPCRLCSLEMLHCSAVTTSKHTQANITIDNMNNMHDVYEYNSYVVGRVAVDGTASLQQGPRRS